jgi:hypothetical protein
MINAKLNGLVGDIADVRHRFGALQDEVVAFRVEVDLLRTENQAVKGRNVFTLYFLCILVSNSCLQFIAKLCLPISLLCKFVSNDKKDNSVCCHSFHKYDSSPYHADYSVCKMCLKKQSMVNRCDHVKCVIYYKPAVITF